MQWAGAVSPGFVVAYRKGAESLYATSAGALCTKSYW